MKKTCFLVVLLSALSASVMAQTEKGRWQVGTQVGNFTYQAQNGGKNFSGSISPAGGLFVVDNLLVGVSVPLSYSAHRFPNNISPSTSSTSIGYGVAPFVRYYVGNRQLKPYGGVSYSYSQTVTKRTQTGFAGQIVEMSDKGTTSDLTPTIGIAYFLTNNVALNAGLNYSIQSYQGTARDLNDNPVSYTNKWRTTSLGVGLQVFFGKKV